MVPAMAQGSRPPLACARFARSRPIPPACMQLRSTVAIMVRVAAIAIRLIRRCRLRIPASSIYRLNVPATCGACHAEITALFDNSIHGLAAYNGVVRLARLHGLPRRTPNPRRDRGRLSRIRHQHSNPGMRPLPFGCATRREIRSGCGPGAFLRRQLPRSCRPRWRAGGRKLRQLPRGTQHPAVQRSCLPHSSGQPGRDLRQMPCGCRQPVRDRTCTHRGRPNTQHRRALDQAHLYPVNLGHRAWHAFAQPARPGQKDSHLLVVAAQTSQARCRSWNACRDRSGLHTALPP